MKYVEGEPMVVFPGDEFISRASYEACMQSKYGSLVPGVMSAAAIFGIRVDEDTAERWKRVAVAGGMLDTFLDEAPDREEAVELYKYGIRHIRGEGDRPKSPYWADEHLDSMVFLLENSVAVLPAKRKNTLLNCAETIAEISVEKAATTSVEKYIELLKLEGQLSGLLVSESASEPVYDQQRYERFGAWVMKLMEAGVLIDSAVDLRRDRIDSLTHVDSSHVNQSRIALSGLKGLYSVTHGSNLRAMIHARRAVKAHKLHR